jgi:hypothetical protein
LDDLLASYNLFSTVYFPTRLQNKSAMAIDNIFDTYKFANYVVFPLLNGLSDHDAQLIQLSDIDLKIQNAKRDLYLLCRNSNDAELRSITNCIPEFY